MTPDDIVYAQYREAGVLLHRGYTMKQMYDILFWTNLPRMSYDSPYGSPLPHV